MTEQGGTMTPEIRAIVDRARTLVPAIAEGLAGHGGILRCTECKTERPLGDVAGHLGHGWPKCCGYTMRWVTQRQLDEEKTGG